MAAGQDIQDVAVRHASRVEFGCDSQLDLGSGGHGPILNMLGLLLEVRGSARLSGEMEDIKDAQAHAACEVSSFLATSNHPAL